MGPRKRFRFNPNGTRFRIFPQSRRLGFAAETVCVDARPGSIGVGPSDATLSVVDALDKSGYFSDATGKLKRHVQLPYHGDVTPRPATPERGHFSHLQPGGRRFTSAMTFAVIRVTKEIWSHFFARPLGWHFARPALEVHPRINSNNSWSGDGFLEFGFPDYPFGDPFAEDCEVVAHETGHLILKYIIGTMPDDEKSVQHRAHEEAGADLVALVVALHFDTVIDRVLDQTGGFLYSANVLSRIGEWGRGDADVERAVFNESTMDSVRGARTVNKHLLSEPFSGAVYDVLVRIFVRHLVAAGAITRALGDGCRHRPGVAVRDLSAEFQAAARRRRREFAEALRRARDDLGWLLASAWQRTALDGVVFGRVLTHLLRADAELRTGYGDLFLEAFRARGIVPIPAALRRAPA